jgi:hypothetical protein
MDILKLPTVPGDLVKIECSNRFLNGKIGTLLLLEENQGPVYGTCVMIDGVVYGFDKSEIREIQKNK